MDWNDTAFDFTLPIDKPADKMDILNKLDIN